MARIISVAARYSGTVAFTDNTKEYFHCQMENDRLWAVDQDGSRLAEQKVKWFNTPGGGYPYYARENQAWRGLPFLSNATLDSNYAVIDKTINDVVMRGEIIFALDDNTSYPATLVYDSWGGYQWITPGNLAVTNLAEYTAKLQNMLLQILSVAVLVPA